MKTFNVLEYGVTGKRADDARPGIQRAVDACAEAGGGMVYLPPGEYTSGMIRLQSHVRFHVEAGATLYASKNRADYDGERDERIALLYAEDAQNVTLEGRGTVNGQAEYEWRLPDDRDPLNRENLDEFVKSGKQPLRAFPRRNNWGRLVLLLRCIDVRIEGLSFMRAPAGAICACACGRLAIDGAYIRSSLKEAVAAGGIDADGCGDVRVSNCTIETGDDALSLSSSSQWGPALPCENVTVTNCRLSSASSAVSIGGRNSNRVRGALIDNCVITDSNRGIAITTFDGGAVSDLIVSNCIIDCRRFDWFWPGDGDPLHVMSRQRRGAPGAEPGRVEPPAGAIRNVQLRNIIAHGKSRCLLQGHPEQWLSGVHMDGVQLFLSVDPKADYNKEGSGFTIRHARDIELHNVAAILEGPGSPKWRSPLSFEDAEDVLVEGFRGRLVPDSMEPAISLKNVTGAVIRNSRVDPENATLLLAGVGTKDVIVGTGVMPPANAVEQEAGTLRPLQMEGPHGRAPVKTASAAPRRAGKPGGKPAARKPAARKTAAPPPARKAARKKAKPARAARTASGTPKKKR
jgi:hypothetical protein